jgi:hypothetical protein
MANEPIVNARRGGAGILVEVDTQTDAEGHNYPVCLVKAADGSLRALHFQEPGQIAALAKAAPSVGDRLSLSADNLHVDRPDNFGERGMARVPAADWSRWGNAAYRRLPGGHDALRPEPVSPAPAVAAPRVRREVRMPNGQIGHTYDPPDIRRSQVVPDRDNKGLEVRR